MSGSLALFLPSCSILLLDTSGLAIAMKRSDEPLIVRTPPGQDWLRAGSLMLAGGFAFLCLIMTALDTDLPQPGRMWLALAFGGSWAIAFLLLLAWTIHSSVHQLQLDKAGLRYLGLFKAVELTWEKVESVHWKRSSVMGSQVLLKGGAIQIAIAFELYDPNDNLEVIPFLRAHLCQAVQSGWADFEANGFPKPVDWKLQAEQIGRFSSFVLKCWAVALPVMYAISIYEKLVLDPENTTHLKGSRNWWQVILGPVSLALVNYLGIVLCYLNATLKIKKKSEFDAPKMD